MLSISIIFEEEFNIPMKKRKKIQLVNLKTGRKKNFKRIKHLTTTIPPEKRTLKNMPRYANKESKVRFQDWLLLKKSPNIYCKYNNTSWGWSPNGKCYGWSHRAIHGFKKGDKIQPSTIGSGGKSFTLKTNNDVERMAKQFTREVS